MGNRSRSAEQTIAALARAANGPNGFDLEAARETAEDFESTFISALVDTMFSGLETDGPFGGGQSESMFRSMLNEEYSKVMSASGGLGLADNVLDSIIRMQTGIVVETADTDIDAAPDVAEAGE